MELCMRRCSRSTVGATPASTMRSKRLNPSPCRCACLESTVAGSCAWSPTRTTCSQPWPSATRAAGSQACVHSSTMTRWKCPTLARASRASIPLPMQVATTTCAACTTFHSSPVTLASDSLLRPTRTLRMPKLRRRLWRLSAATFESATASTLSPLGECRCDQAAMMAQATWVFPVPGGPWIRHSRCSSARCRATRCDAARAAHQGKSRTMCSTVASALGWPATGARSSRAAALASSAAPSRTLRTSSLNW
mmetsp:Transcript_93191/g.263775  ORF Transcript_93191/g.263775 Transcript_93191/m.263775 type:complete len:251 (+) Transcript_93191:992-1744(+)